MSYTDDICPPTCPCRNPIPEELNTRLNNLAFEKETDAVVWAEAFVELSQIKDVYQDVGTMIGWFANAIMNGYDQGVEAGRKQYEPKIEIEATDLFYLAGQLSVPYMRDNPNYVMPTEEVTEIVEDFVSDHAQS